MSNIGPTGKESGVGWSSDTVEREIIGLLQDMTVDWDNEFSGSIDGETRLVADLGFTSIDVVQLAVPGAADDLRRALRRGCERCRTD